MLSADDGCSWLKIAAKIDAEASSAYSIELQSRNSAVGAPSKKERHLVMSNPDVISCPGSVMNRSFDMF